MTVTQREDLAARLDGTLLREGEPGWSDALVIWNGMAAAVPALVVRPASAADVAAAVTFAREQALPLSVKGGGHNIAGTSIADQGLVLDMSGMSRVTIDPGAKLAHVGPGCRLQDVDRATQAHGLATPLGFVSEVGVAGLTLGGGLGYLTRRFGWTVDNLEDVEIVTADGAIRTASHAENADLFWALRGGGGNFGVVTRFTFRLHEVGPTVYGGLIAWPFARADEILPAYRAITTGAPRELAVWLELLHAPPAPFIPEQWHGERLCAMAVCYSGDLAGVDEALAPIRALGTPVVDLLHEQPYTQIQSYLDATDPKGMHYYWKTNYLAELSDDFLVRARGTLRRMPDSRGGPRRPPPRRRAQRAARGRRRSRQPRRPLGLRRQRQVGPRRAERRGVPPVDAGRVDAAAPVLDRPNVHQLPDRRRRRRPRARDLRPELRPAYRSEDDLRPG
jgi:hypothetical protein